MVIKSLLDMFFGLINFIIGLLPTTPTVAVTFGSILDLLKYGVYFVGAPMFALIISNFLAWCVIDLSWAIIEWVYKKIPGVS